jgi:hypothetical protein
MDHSPRNQFNMVQNSIRKHERWQGDNSLHLLFW